MKQVRVYDKGQVNGVKFFIQKQTQECQKNQDNGNQVSLI
jgi:hypothetical protein